ncbi:GAF domain-containing protein [Paludibacter jiangxiensis]|uniref:GAF domain-containing protein n=1 Tax=Paludibacter jiangxiensis TaxID=681398 RepID=A0A161L7F1_9BACT|nr:GAF domain-containing protein [Paludibacter jiangxiensis]GAT62644.1 GAF domain-containing protein [Paludibacter jiangxiensis]
MSESIVKLEGVSKLSQYESLFAQLKSLLGGEKDVIANMANAAAAIKEVFGFFWVGFYIVRENQLVLGPFQGPIACTRIAFGRGVCGTAWKEASTLIVPDVDAFPGHIACSSLSKSEIVVPLMHEQKVWAVLDVDSDQLDTFDAVDREFLEKIVVLINEEE